MEDKEDKEDKEEDEEEVEGKKNYGDIQAITCQYIRC